MSKSLAHALAAAALIFFGSHQARAQSSLQSTPAPTITAESEAWYLTGGPVSFGGSVYYPAGPLTHFDRNDMVRTGLVGSTPVYARTTQEPGSIIYAPLAGGLMKPYERRRSGDLAGTVGSNAPSFTVVLPAEEASRSAAATPLSSPATTPLPVGTSGYVPPAAAEAPPETAIVPAPVGTAGTVPGSTTRPIRTRIQTAQRPVGLNAVYVDFQNARWFGAGPAVEFVADRFTRIGEHRGFGVYQETGRAGTIYLSLLDGDPGLLAPYKTR